MMKDIYSVGRTGIITAAVLPNGYEFDATDTTAEIRNILLFGVLILIIIGVLLGMRKVRL